MIIPTKRSSEKRTNRPKQNETRIKAEEEKSRKIWNTRNTRICMQTSLGFYSDRTRVRFHHYKHFIARPLDCPNTAFEMERDYILTRSDSKEVPIVSLRREWHQVPRLQDPRLELISRETFAWLRVHPCLSIIW